MDIIAYKGRHISFLLMNLHIICTNALVGDHLVLKMTLFWNIKVEWDDGGHLESIDALGPGRRILITRAPQAGQNTPVAQ